MRLPLHGLKNAMKGGKLLFPHLREWREVTLFSEELRLGETQGLYEYEPIDGIAFPAAIKMGGVQQQLTGGGTRTKYGVAKVYALALYDWNGSGLQGAQFSSVINRLVCEHATRVHLPEGVPPREDGGCW